MLGLPSQTKLDVLNTLKMLISKKLTHISLYTLILEENTPLFKKVNSGELKLPTEDETIDMFDECLKLLEENNFTRYEVANFAKENKICKHNLGYWTNKNYLGFVLSSHAKVDNTRFCNTSNLEKYVSHNFIENIETLSKTQIREEKIMLGLRTNKGINLNLVKTKTTEIEKLKQHNLIEIKNNHIFATTKGMYVLNQIILMLV